MEARRIVLRDGKLFVANSPDDRLELMALSDNRFQLRVFPVVYTFEQATAGAQRLTVQPPGEEKPDVFDRVAEFQPTASQLAGYAGDYVSAEIEPVYRIVVENGGLVLKRLKSKPQKLDPTVQDYFEAQTGNIHFQRDSAGKVTGFVLDTGRIKNFRFRKTAQS